MPDQPLPATPANPHANESGNAPPPPLPPTVKGNDDGECKHNERDSRKIEKPKEHWTKYIEAFCGITLVVITWYYTRAAYRQAVASEDAAHAAKGAVAVAANTLTETQRSNARQECLNDQTRNEARIASNAAAKQAKAALQVTIDNFHEEQRPWLVANVVPADPITYDKEGGHISLLYSIVNVGHNPAIGVRIYTEVHFLNKGSINSWAERNKICMQQKAWSPLFGDTIAQGQFFQTKSKLVMSNADLDYSAKEWGFYSFEIVDCIGYHANYRNDFFSVGSIYTIGRKPDNPDIGPLAPLEHQDIPLADIDFRMLGLGGTQTQ